MGVLKRPEGRDGVLPQRLSDSQFDHFALQPHADDPPVGADEDNLGLPVSAVEAWDGAVAHIVPEYGGRHFCLRASVRRHRRALESPTR
jgi:hypothetical protein